jgi:hypothetical protein
MIEQTWDEAELSRTVTNEGLLRVHLKWMMQFYENKTVMIHWGPIHLIFLKSAI